MTEATESMMRRVEELLKRAEDFRRHGEDGSADAANALAEKIMLKHSIDQSIIAARLAAGQQPNNDEIIIDWMEYSGIYRKALVVQFGALVMAYTDTIKVFVQQEGNVEKLALVGYRSEVEQLKLLLTSLHLQVIASISIWWKASPLRDQLEGMEAYKARRSYAYNWISGATDRIARARRAAVQEAVDSDPGTALALQTRGSLVERWLNKRFNLRLTSTQLKGGHPEAGRAGYRAGQQANTGDRPIGSNRLQLGR